MGAPSRGAQHYILLLIPSLLDDIQRLGIKHIITQSDLTERDITSLYFDVKSIAQLLPDDPVQVDPAIWGELVHCIRMMQLLVNEAAGSDLARARRKAVNTFLPQARQSLLSEFEKRRRQGNVDFRLAGFARAQAGDGRAEETCMEALRLERQRHYENLMAIKVNALTWHQAVVVQEARSCVQQEMVRPPDEFDTVDLLVSLLDLLRNLLNRPAPDKPLEADIKTVVLSLGNMLYREELGLETKAQPRPKRVV